MAEVEAKLKRMYAAGSRTIGRTTLRFAAGPTKIRCGPCLLREGGPLARILRGLRTFLGSRHCFLLPVCRTGSLLKSQPLLR
jgi:hypothetical protein